MNYDAETKTMTELLADWLRMQLMIATDQDPTRQEHHERERILAEINRRCPAKLPSPGRWL